MSQPQKEFEDALLFRYCYWKEGPLYKRIVDAMHAERSSTFAQRNYVKLTRINTIIELIAAFEFPAALYLSWRAWQNKFDPFNHWKRFSKYSYANTNAKTYMNVYIFLYGKVDLAIRCAGIFGAAAGVGLMFVSWYMKYVYRPRMRVI